MRTGDNATITPLCSLRTGKPRGGGWNNGRSRAVDGEVAIIKVEKRKWKREKEKYISWRRATIQGRRRIARGLGYLLLF